MSDNPQASMHAPRGAQGGRGSGAKDKTQNPGGQMQIDAMAGIVRAKPSGDSSPDASQKKGREQGQQDSPHAGKGGAKEVTHQNSAGKSSQEHQNATSSNTLQQPSEWRLPQPQRGSKAPGKQRATRAETPGAKEVPEQKGRRQQQDSSDSEEMSPANQMEVEPNDSAARQSNSPTATDILSSTHLSEQPPAPAPPMPTVPEASAVPERGEKGGDDDFAQLSDVGSISAKKGATPKAAADLPQASIIPPKIAVINPDTTGQAKISHARLLSSLWALPPPVITVALCRCVTREVTRGR